jgi:hypothetical protein
VTRLQRAGIDIDLPQTWEGRIFTRGPGVVPSGPASRTSSTDEAPASLPILHAANFALPVEVGDFGGGAVELMNSSHIFLAVVDYGSESAGTPLFAARTVPRRLTVNDFRADTLQRTLAGQSGTQRFFTAAGRGFCLYVVLGTHLLRGRLIPILNGVIGTLAIS